MHNVGTHPVIIGGVSAVFGKLGYLQLLGFERSRCVGLVFGNWCRTNGSPERFCILELIVVCNVCIRGSLWTGFYYFFIFNFFSVSCCVRHFWVYFYVYFFVGFWGLFLSKFSVI